MSSTDHHEAAIAALREAVALESVPAEVVAAARATYTWRTIDAELAALAFDSQAAGELVGARGSANGPRSLSFEYGSVAIEVEASVDSRGNATLQGQVAPGKPSAIEVHHADSTEPFLATLRPNGLFEVVGVPVGAIRLMVRFSLGAGPAMLLTEWVTI